MPALLTRMSASGVCCVTRATPAASDRSAATPSKSALGMAARRCASADCTDASLRPLTTTRAGAREPFGDREPDAGGGGGNDRGLAFQIDMHVRDGRGMNGIAAGAAADGIQSLGETARSGIEAEAGDPPIRLRGVAQSCTVSVRRPNREPAA